MARIVPSQSRQRRTRIVATIGPASDDEDLIAALVRAGMDVARVSLSHGSVEESIQVIRRIRNVSPDIGILPDLPGPKVRCSAFAARGVQIQPGNEIRICSSELAPRSSAARLGIDDAEVIASLAPGDVLSLGDGAISIEIIDRHGSELLGRVRSGGRLFGRPGVAVATRHVRNRTPTTDDLERIAALKKEGIDALAVSFVHDAEDVQAIRAALDDPEVMLVSKIETAEAITNLEAVVRESDAVMVARGDLGIGLPIEEVPFSQKEIIRTGARFGRPVITATQMLESMISSPVPTRAEVTDVANAVLDGTSAVMLSGETAIGFDPVNVVRTMSRILERAESEIDHSAWGINLGTQELTQVAPLSDITAVISGAAWRASLDGHIAAVIACTRSGATARAISRFRPSIPIIAVTPSERTRRQLSMSWGVKTVLSRHPADNDSEIWQAVQAVLEAGYVSVGDVVVVIAGSPYESLSVVDTLRIVRVRR